MELENKWKVEQIFDTLSDVHGHRSDKIEAEKQGLYLSEPDEIEKLRTKCVEALEGEFKLPAPGQDEVNRIRAWLLSMVARIDGHQPRTKTYVEKHLLPGSPDYDPDEWTRYWTLEGLVFNCLSRGGDTYRAQMQTICQHLVPLAEQITASDDEESTLVRMLAYAILAAADDASALRHIRVNLLEGDETQVYHALRALRIVPLHGHHEHDDVFQKLVEIVNEGQATDSTYSAVHALGALSPNSPQAEEAAHALVNFIVRFRRSQLHDGLRSRVLLSLGNLKVSTTAETILQEFLDYNPAITRDAAQALQKVLDIPLAVARVVEKAAGDTTREERQRYARGLRYMTPEAQVVDALEEIMLSGKQAHRQVAEDLLSRVGGVAAFEKLRARRKIMDEYWKIMNTSQADVQNLFDASMQEAREGYNLMMAADKLRYHMGLAVVGFLLVILGVVYLLFAKPTLAEGLVAALATLGGGFMVSWFERMIDKPRRLMQENVDRIMRQKAVYLAYLRQLYQLDQAYALEILSDDRVTLMESGYFNKAVSTTMDVAIHSLDGELPPELRAALYQASE